VPPASGSRGWIEPGLDTFWGDERIQDLHGLACRCDARCGWPTHLVGVATMSLGVGAAKNPGQGAMFTGRKRTDAGSARGVTG